MAADGRAFMDDRNWKKFLENARNKLSKKTHVLKVAYSTIGFRDILDHFKKEVGSDGNSWLKSERAEKENGKTLQDTGHMRRSFLPTNTKAINRDSIIIFNSAPYSGVHDRGSTKKNIPKRDFMYFTDRATERMAKFVLGQIFQ